MPPTFTPPQMTSLCLVVSTYSTIMMGQFLRDFHHSILIRIPDKRFRALLIDFLLDFNTHHYLLSSMPRCLDTRMLQHNSELTIQS